MTIQFKILTTSRSIGNDINPFYEATESEVRKNWTYAQKCYKRMEVQIINMWCAIEGERIGIIGQGANTLESMTKQTKVLIGAVKEGRIGPINKKLLVLTI